MNRQELEQRTKKFSLEAIRLTSALPRSVAADVLGRQFLRSATAIGAIYREAARAESRRDFVHKVTLSAKEAAETEYWLELLIEASIGEPHGFLDLKQEADELLRILIASARTAKLKLAK
ncbi:MAG TPA: four helix bundle protein [Thermoanaerobaculia bacterium]|nr:four helix bundle protein [Thermoanaerobaculia bacterium]